MLLLIYLVAATAGRRVHPGIVPGMAARVDGEEHASASGRDREGNLLV